MLKIDYFKILGIILCVYYIQEMPKWYIENINNILNLIEGELVCVAMIIFTIGSLLKNISSKLKIILNITGYFTLAWYTFKGLPLDIEYLISNHNLLGIWWVTVDIVSMYYIVTYFTTNYLIESFTLVLSKYKIANHSISRFILGNILILTSIFNWKTCNWLKA